jgi:hypothetical protein
MNIKISLLTIGLLILLAGCKVEPASETQQSNQEQSSQPTEETAPNPNNPDSYGVVKICGDGTNVYLLQGGNYSGQYAIWNDTQWEPLSAGTSPDTVCQ